MKDKVNVQTTYIHLTENMAVVDDETISVKTEELSDVMMKSLHELSSDLATELDVHSDLVADRLFGAVDELVMMSIFARCRQLSYTERRGKGLC